MDNENNPKGDSEETVDANEEAITGRAEAEEEFEDTDDDSDEDDVDADADTQIE